MVAQLDWSAHDQLGMATIQQREQFMSYMVMKGKTSSYVRHQSNDKCLKSEPLAPVSAYSNRTVDFTNGEEENKPMHTMCGLFVLMAAQGPHEPMLAIQKRHTTSDVSSGSEEHTCREGACSHGIRLRRRSTATGSFDSVVPQQVACLKRHTRSLMLRSTDNRPK